MLPNVNLNPADATQTTQSKQQNMKININFPIKVAVEIIPGFTVPEDGKAKWEWSADQHALKFYIHEQQSAQGQTEYLVKLIGTLYYNVSLVGLAPVNSAFFVKPGATTPIAFTSHGSYHINEVIGTYASVADIQQLDLSNFLVTAVLDKIVGVDSTGTVQDIEMDEPNSLRQYLVEAQEDNSAPKGHVAIQGNHSITITYQNPPIS